MIMICINNKPIKSAGSASNLTIGRKYKVLNDPSDFTICGVMVKNDKGVIFYYNHIRFISLSIYRKNKLDKLLNN